MFDVFAINFNKLFGISDFWYSNNKIDSAIAIPSFFLYKNFYYVINDRGVKVFGFRSKCGHIQVIYISKKKILNIYSNRDRLSLRTQNCISLIKIVQKSFIFIFWYPLFFISISNSTNKTRRIQFSVWNFNSWFC